MHVYEILFDNSYIYKTDNEITHEVHALNFRREKSKCLKYICNVE